MSQQSSARQSGAYNIVSANDFGSSASKLLLIPRRKAGTPTTGYYAVELRSPYSPFDTYSLTAQPVTGVTIRLVPPLTERLQTRLIDTVPETVGNTNDAPLQPGQTFTDPDYGISITNNAVKGTNASLAVTMPELPDTTPPSMPTIKSATPRGNTVQLSWTAPSDDEDPSFAQGHYEVFRNGAMVAATKELTLTDASPGPGKNYYWVDAVDQAGNRSQSSSAVEVDFPTTVVSAPSATPAPGGGLNPSITSNATVQLTSPALKKHKAKVPKSGKLVFKAPGAARIKLDRGSKTVRTVHFSTLRYTLPKKYRKGNRKKAIKLSVTATIAGKPHSAMFRIAKGVIEQTS